jgi:hypothetical protein
LGVRLKNWQHQGLVHPLHYDNLIVPQKNNNYKYYVNKQLVTICCLFIGIVPQYVVFLESKAYKDQEIIQTIEGVTPSATLKTGLWP